MTPFLTFSVVVRLLYSLCIHVIGPMQQFDDLFTSGLELCWHVRRVKFVQSYYDGVWFSYLGPKLTLRGTDHEEGVERKPTWGMRWSPLWGQGKIGPHGVSGYP